MRKRLWHRLSQFIRINIAIDDAAFRATFLKQTERFVCIRATCQFVLFRSMILLKNDNEIDALFDSELLIDDLQTMIRDDANYQRLYCTLSLLVKFSSTSISNDAFRHRLLPLLYHSSTDISALTVALIKAQKEIIDSHTANRLFEQWCSSENTSAASAIMQAIMIKYIFTVLIYIHNSFQ